MKNVKTPTSVDYHEWLIESLQDPEESSGYIEVLLDEGTGEPELMQKVLSNVVEAYTAMNQLSESAQQYHKKLHKILSKSGGTEIDALIKFLDALGFQVKIVPK